MRGRPAPFRQSLVRDLALLVLLLGAAILAANVISTRRAVETLSSTVISRSFAEIEGRLAEYFNPVSDGLELVRQWIDDGALNPADPDDVRDMIVPVLERHPQISSALIADDRGREIMLLRQPDGWILRETRADEWGGRSHLREINADGTVTESEPELNYDPRTRPWFENARKTPGEAVWTAPYTFFTTQEPGITSSLGWRDESGRMRVVGFDVLLSDISNFTYELNVSPRGAVCILTHDGRIVGLPRDDQYADPKDRLTHLLGDAAQLSLPALREAAGAAQTDGGDTARPRRFRSGGESWWGVAKTHEIPGGARVLLVAVTPNADVVGATMEFRIAAVGIIILFIGVAIFRARQLGAMYGRPIEALVQQSERIRDGDLEAGEHIESHVLEVQHLADAQDDMRQSIRTMLRMEQDLAVARQIQQSAFPDALPEFERYDIAAWSGPAEETGGDGYDVIGFRRGSHGVEPTITDPTHALLMLADATGHGVGPALCAAQAMAMLRMAFRSTDDLPQLAGALNAQLVEDLPDDRFITMWLGLLNAEANRLRTVSAGQGPLLHHVAATGETRIFGADGPPLGIVSPMDIEPPDPIQLEPGDFFIVLSDGFFEASNPRDELLGTDRVVETIKINAHLDPQSLLGALRERTAAHCAGRPPSDDQTAIIIKRNA